MDEVGLEALSDWELLACSRRDPEAFGEFYDRHVEAVFKYCSRRTADSWTAADLTAEVFAGAYLRRTAVRRSDAPALAWLYGIARRQLASFHRKEAVADRARRRLGMSRQIPEDEEARVDQLTDLEPIRGPLVSALAGLPATQSAAVRLRVLEARPYTEVAAALGCSEGAARVRVSRALTRLHDELESEAQQTRTW